MRFALVDEAGNVANVVEAGAGFDPGAGLTLIPATGGVEPGWNWRDSEFQRPVEASNIAHVVSDLQFRRALTILGLREQAETLIASGSRDLQDYWDRALLIDRHSPLVAEAAKALGKSDAEIGALFDLAATL